MRRKNQKVFVAMSGGVDSSVAAALLKKRGYSVTGIFMRCWSDPKGKCFWRQDQQDARRVAAHLEIPFYTFNFEKEYRSKVVKWFISGYQSGQTPNPDVLCNQEIKFGLFLKKALNLGADFIATGHHVRLRPKSKTQNSCFCPLGYGEQAKSKIYRLFKGVDSSKDQSYFLWTLTQDQLKHSLFPVGEYTKKRVRKIAKNLGLHNWNKADSQGICFIGQVNLFDFLKKFIPLNKGPIVTTNGRKIGEHLGIFFYTIGQRHGLGIGGGKPYYVVDKVPSTNTLIVGLKNDPQLFKKRLRAGHINWITGKEPKMPLQCRAKIRYLQPDQEVKVIKSSPAVLEVLFEKPQRAITPGQSIVFYQGQELLGGGVII